MLSPSVEPGSAPSLRARHLGRSADAVVRPGAAPNRPRRSLSPHTPGSVPLRCAAPSCAARSRSLMSTSRPPWRVPGVVLFSQGDLSYEVDLSREVVAELAQSRLGERTV